MSKKIIVLGISCVDIVVSNVTELPKSGTLNLVNSIKMYTGGCATNIAIDLGKIGIPSSIITPLGHDDFGDFLMQSLIKNNVNVNHVLRSSKHPTSASIVTISPDGERSFLHQLGYNGVFEAKDINKACIETSDILMITGTFLMDAFDGEGASSILQHAQKHGVYTVLDTAWDPRGRWMETLAPCLSYVDLFAPSEDEARMLTGASTIEDMVKVFNQYGVNDLIIKRGKDGAYARIAGIEYNVPPYLVKNPVDSTGAGDSFMSGILTGLYLGYSPIKMLKFANAVGAFCVQSEGASSGIAPMDSILKFMEKEDNNETRSS